MPFSPMLSRLRRSEHGAAGRAGYIRQPWHASIPQAALSRAALLHCRGPGVVVGPYSARLLHGAVILSREGAVALLRAHEILCAIYDNANALGHPYITGWEISTVDYQSLEDFLYPESEAEASE